MTDKRERPWWIRPWGVPPSVEARQRDYLRNTPPEERIRRIHLMLVAQGVVMIMAVVGMVLTTWFSHPGSQLLWLVLMPVEVVLLAGLLGYTYRRVRIIEEEIRSGRA